MNWTEFFSSSGRGVYIWASFGAFVIAIILEIVLVRLRGKRINAEIEEEIMAGKTRGSVR